MARETRSTKRAKNAQTQLSLRNRTVQRLDYVDPSPSKPVRVNRQRPTLARGLSAREPVSPTHTRIRTTMPTLDKPTPPISPAVDTFNPVNPPETAAEPPMPMLDNPTLPISPAVDTAADPPQSVALSTMHKEMPVEKPSPDTSSVPTPSTPATCITVEAVSGGAESQACGDEGTSAMEIPSTSSELPHSVHDRTRNVRNVRSPAPEHTQTSHAAALDSPPSVIGLALDQDTSSPQDMTANPSAGDASGASKEDVQEPEAYQDAQDALGVSEEHTLPLTLSFRCKKLKQKVLISWFRF
ncbi:hypothetical protein VKT23_019328 [Stygiomarasmius scandens]|uniref:Uncharacterized protein n=1 Tax=Marasmiellus scandens TaxID=2682957 RepID=A0ABR1INB8_9AGAR